MFDLCFLKKQKLVDNNVFNRGLESGCFIYICFINNYNLTCIKFENVFLCKAKTLKSTKQKKAYAHSS